MGTHPIGEAFPETVGGALIRRGRVLLGLRSVHKSFGGCWDLIGGHVEADETLMSALRRELREELGVDGVEADYLQTLAIIDSENRLSTLHVFSVTAWRGRPAVRDDEHLAIQWFDLEEAMRLPNLATDQYHAVFASLLRRR